MNEHLSAETIESYADACQAQVAGLRALFNVGRDEPFVEALAAVACRTLIVAIESPFPVERPPACLNPFSASTRGSPRWSSSSTSCR